MQTFAPTCPVEKDDRSMAVIRSKSTSIIFVPQISPFLSTYVCRCATATYQTERQSRPTTKPHLQNNQAPVPPQPRLRCIATKLHQTQEKAFSERQLSPSCHTSRPRQASSPAWNMANGDVSRSISQIFIVRRIETRTTFVC